MDTSLNSLLGAIMGVMLFLSFILIVYETVDSFREQTDRNPHREDLKFVEEELESFCSGRSFAPKSVFIGLEDNSKMILESRELSIQVTKRENQNTETVGPVTIECGNEIGEISLTDDNQIERRGNFIMSQVDQGDRIQVEVVRE